MFNGVPDKLVFQGLEGFSALAHDRFRMVGKQEITRISVQNDKLM